MTSFSDQYACSGQFLLQFPTRYLEWITIAREHSIDPTTSLDFNARTDGLTEDERKEILSVGAYLGVNPEIFFMGGGRGGKGLTYKLLKTIRKGPRIISLIEIFSFLLLFQWEFEYIDRDKNNVLDTAEIQDVFSDVLDFEPCLYGFLKSCDLNEKEGIDKREWDFCFPKTGISRTIRNIQTIHS